MNAPIKRFSGSAQKTALSVFLAVLVVGMAGLGAAAGAELADKTVSVDDNTNTVNLEVTNTSGDAVNYTVYGVSDGLTTEEYSGQISALSNDTAREEFMVNATTYDSYRVVVTEDASDSDNETVESISISKSVDQVSSSDGGAMFAGGSGGGLLGFGALTAMNSIIGVLVVAAAFLLGLFDPLKRRLSG